MNEEEIKYILEILSFKTSIYRDKSKRNLSYNDDEYYSNVLYQYITKLQNNWNELKEFITEQIDENRLKMLNIGGISGSLYSRENDALRDVIYKMQELEKKQ